jgi:hypothetical protein
LLPFLSPPPYLSHLLPVNPHYVATPYALLSCFIDGALWGGLLEQHRPFIIQPKYNLFWLLVARHNSTSKKVYNKVAYGYIFIMLSICCYVLLRIVIVSPATILSQG